MAYVTENKAKQEDVWFLDSGCSNHMTGNKKWFDKIDDRFTHSVKLGNDTSMTVRGKGDIKLQVQGRTQVISNVLYIPELRTNLLSVGQLQEKGVAIVI